MKYVVPEDLYYTSTHEWVRITNDVGVVGITDYAQDMLHDIVFVDLPEIGKKVRKGEAFMEIESVKSVAEVYAPLSGEIIEVNEKLSESPEIINSSPYEEGWLVKIKIENIEEVQELLDAAKYRMIIEGGEK